MSVEREEDVIPYTAFWSTCLALLSVGAVCVGFCLLTIWQHRHRLHPINQAAVLMFVADIQMIVNFLPREIAIVGVWGGLDGEASEHGTWWCTVSAVWTISSCVALSFAAVCIAYVTWQTVENRTVPFRLMAAWCGTGWAVGLVLASSFGAAGLLGPFRGLYCCTTSNSVPEVAVPIFIVFAASVAGLVVCYRRAVIAAERVQRLFADRATAGSSGNRGGAAGRGSAVAAAAAAVSPRHGNEHGGAGHVVFAPKPDAAKAQPLRLPNQPDLIVSQVSAPHAVGGGQVMVMSSLYLPPPAVPGQPPALAAPYSPVAAWGAGGKAAAPSSALATADLSRGPAAPSSALLPVPPPPRLVVESGDTATASVLGTGTTGTTGVVTAGGFGPGASGAGGGGFGASTAVGTDGMGGSGAVGGATWGGVSGAGGGTSGAPPQPPPPPLDPFSRLRSNAGGTADAASGGGVSPQHGVEGADTAAPEDTALVPPGGGGGAAGGAGAVSPRHAMGTTAAAGGPTGATRTGGADLRDAIARRARLFVAVFYCCWAVTSINAFLSLCGVDVPVESDMAGAVCLKLQPIIDSVLLVMAIRRGATRVRGVAPGRDA